jgi:ABC-type antimicrobial peptide transport system permease subunit
VIMNLFGWLWKTTRKICLVLQGLTFGSWFGLGLIYGIGFCPLTQWHWQVLSRLGELPAETSYFQYLLRRFFGWHVEASLVDITTLICFLIALSASVIVNLQDWLRHKKQTVTSSK